MTLVAEKIVVTAREFLETRNINDSYDFNEPFFQTKIKDFGWGLEFAAPSVVCEIVWRSAMRGSGAIEVRHLDRLFSPSPIATHANFRGCKEFSTGNLPQPGAIAIWKKGNSWKGMMSLVLSVSADNKTFDVAEGKVLTGSENQILTLEEKKGKRTDLPFKNDKMNLMGFVYPPNREIS